MAAYTLGRKSLLGARKHYVILRNFFVGEVRVNHKANVVSVAPLKFKSSDLSRKPLVARSVFTSACRCCKTEPVADDGDNAVDDVNNSKAELLNHKRVTVHPPETSIRYLESKAYRNTYGADPVWTNYRRNHKGQFPQRKTRRTCIRGGEISTGNPCPICRDEYLVIHHTNIKLLEQFISPYTGETLQPYKTGVCRVRQFELDLAILKAKDLGLLSYEVPFRHYNYADYYPQLKDRKSNAEDASS